MSLDEIHELILRRVLLIGLRSESRVAELDITGDMRGPRDQEVREVMRLVGLESMRAFAEQVQQLCDVILKVSETEDQGRCVSAC